MWYRLLEKKLCSHESGFLRICAMECVLCSIFHSKAITSGRSLVKTKWTFQLVHSASFHYQFLSNWKHLYLSFWIRLLIGSSCVLPPIHFALFYLRSAHLHLPFVMWVWTMPAVRPISTFHRKLYSARMVMCVSNAPATIISAEPNLSTKAKHKEKKWNYKRFILLNDYLTKPIELKDRFLFL